MKKICRYKEQKKIDDIAQFFSISQILNSFWKMNEKWVCTFCAWHYEINGFHNFLSVFLSYSTMYCTMYSVPCTHPYNFQERDKSTHFMCTHSGTLKRFNNNKKYERGHRKIFNFEFKGTYGLVYGMTNLNSLVFWKNMYL